MFRITKDPSSGSLVHYLAKIKVIVLSCPLTWTWSVLWHHILPTVLVRSSLYGKAQCSTRLLCNSCWSIYAAYPNWTLNASKHGAYYSRLVCFSLWLSIRLYTRNKLTNACRVDDHFTLQCVDISIFVSVINQLDAQNFCFTISLHL